MSMVQKVDILNQSLNNEYRILILEKVLENIITKNPNLLNQPEIEEIKNIALNELQKKYPEAGIKKGDN